jgi:hypothetical protein
MKRLVKKSLRPIYKRFFERPLWGFLGRVKNFFMAETEQRLAAIEERQRLAEANNAAQWDALEQLLLALFRQPEIRMDPNESGPPRDEAMSTSSAGYKRSHERQNIR